MSFIEGESIAYVTACKLYADLQATIYDIKNWNAIAEGIRISEITYRQGGWSRRRRMIVIKQNERIRRKATGKKLRSLFEAAGLEDREVLYQPCYHAFVTSQSLPATQIWEQYKGRADAENRIKELKKDFRAQGYCMDSFNATEAAMKW